MKQIYLLIVALMTMTAAYATAPTSTVMLQHNGNVTFFEPDSIKAAVRESVDGDTIFLNEGTFPGFTIDKKITIRGVQAAKTKITGHICIEASGIQLEGLGLYEGNNYYSIYTYKSINGLNIKKCQFASIFPSGKNTVASDIVIDRCWIDNTFYTRYQPVIDHSTCYNNINSATVLNSYIKYLNTSYVTKADVYLNNCSINGINSSENFRGTLMNCIINCTPTLRECSLINCLLRGSKNIESSVHQNNNYYEDSDYTSAKAETLLEKGYLGNDGTVVGRYGGTNPYTLVLGLPRVTSHTLNVDNAHKTLNVTVKLSE